MEFNMNAKLRSFLKGAATIFDIYPDPIKDPFAGKTDFDRLAEDWQKVGNDIKNAMNEETKGLKI